MEWLNYHHLRYFWLVAREGSLTAAGKLLRVSHPTLSAQIHALETQLGTPLFSKVGRRLVPTAMGQMVFRYAEQIFGLGRDLLSAVRTQNSNGPTRLHIGVVDGIPKLIVRRLMHVALSANPQVQLACHEDTYDQLLADLALHRLDVVIADAPIPSGSTIRAHHHLLGDTGITLFATASLARKYQHPWPAALHGAPMIVPLDTLPLGRAIHQWFDQQQIVPRIVAECADSALLKELGASGLGLFPGPTAVASEIATRYRVRPVGTLNNVREHFYAVSAERRITHPVIQLICDAARLDLFSAKA